MKKRFSESDQTESTSKPKPQKISRIERAFNLLAWVGFLFIVPIVLYLFGKTGALDFMRAHLGRFGEPSLLVLLFFAFLVLKIFFGGDRIILPLFVSYIVGFFLMATIVEIGFMDWYRDFTRRIAFLNNLPLNFLAAASVVLLGILLSHLKHCRFTVQLGLFLVLPVAFLIFNHLTGVVKIGGDVRISLNEGFNILAGIVDDRYRTDPEIIEYIEEVDEKNLALEEKEQLIEELQRRIEKLEAEKKLFEQLKKENEFFREKIARLEKDYASYGWCGASKGNAEEAGSYSEAVRGARARGRHADM